jgi:hypothetical protein
MTSYQLRKRGEANLFLGVGPDVTLSETLHVARTMSGELCTSIDVLDSERYLVTYCGGSPYWWLPGTHGGGMHQISSRGWCHDCRNRDEVPEEHVHHLARDVEVAVLTCEGTHDPVFRERLKKAGLTAKEHAEEAVAWDEG